MCVQRALRHASGPITTREAMEWAYIRRIHQGKPLTPMHYAYTRRALDRIAERVGHGLGRGRPWLWRLKEEASSEDD
jgi:hypothetical protein